MRCGRGFHGVLFTNAAAVLIAGARQGPHVGPLCCAGPTALRGRQYVHLANRGSPLWSTPGRVAPTGLEIGGGNCGLQVLEEARVRSLVEFHAQMSQIALPMFLEQERRFDLAFVDGNHRFDSVFVDLFYLGRLLRKGGIIFLDYYQLPGIRRAVSFYVKNLNWPVEQQSAEENDHHWIALRTAEADDTRDYRYFVDF